MTNEQQAVSPDLISCEFDGRQKNAGGITYSVPWSSNCKPEHVLRDIYEDFEHVTGLKCWRWIDGVKTEFKLPEQNWDA